MLLEIKTAAVSRVGCLLMLILRRTGLAPTINYSGSTSLIIGLPTTRETALRDLIKIRIVLPITTRTVLKGRSPAAEAISRLILFKVKSEGKYFTF